MKTVRTIFLLAAMIAVATSCGGDDAGPTIQDSELTSLPADTGGTHTAHVLGSTTAKFGYYVYLPSGYTGGNHSYPLLIFLHGKTERGDGTNSLSILNKVLANGPPKQIKNNQWNPTHPMIVVSPQYHGEGGNANNWGAGDESNLREFIEYMMDKYRVNKKRIYLTGLSHGGNGVFDYLTKQADNTSYLAAAAPVACYGANSGFNKAKNTPIWVFIGENDSPNINPSKNFVTSYNAQNPAPLHRAKISVFKGAGHNVWDRTYSGSGIGTADPDFDPFNKSLYDWMFEFKRED